MIEKIFHFSESLILEPRLSKMGFVTCTAGKMGTINPFRKENWHILQYYGGHNFSMERGHKSKYIPNIILASRGQIFNIFPFNSPAS